MRTNALLVERTQICAAFGPVDLSAAANNGDWVSLKNFDSCAIIFVKGAGTAGDDPTLTLRQATDASGSSAKALDFTRVDVKQGTLTALGSFTPVTQAAANTYVDLTSAENAGIYVIEVRADELDVANGFDCVQFSVADVGTNAQLGAALYLLRGPRYAPPPSAIVD
ncbi:MAG: hypothetical protein AB7F35_01915 [Acetobacteraceae bacterium]